MSDPAKFPKKVQAGAAQQAKAISNKAAAGPGGVALILDRGNQKDAVAATAHVYPLGDWGNGVPPKQFEFQIDWNDDLIRSKPGMQGFDGLEKGFAWVPYHDQSGSVQWNAIPLSFSGETATSRFGPLYDMHQAQVDTKQLDLGAIQQFGVAFYAETNVGRVWLQHADQNFMLGQ